MLAQTNAEHPPQKITPHLWFDDQAEEAARFYTSIFENARLGTVTRYPDAGQEIHEKEAGTVMTLDFELEGQRFTGLNGGAHFAFTPAISFFVTCETEAEVDWLWQELSDGGTALMELGPYDWSDKYGWVADRYGLSWQISLGNPDDVGQKITPSLMYVTDRGQAEDAMNLYTSLFDDSDISGILRYGADEAQPEGAVMHAQFSLHGEQFMAMDSSPEQADFTFNEAISLLIQCESQEEVDHFWERLTANGGEESMCGWLKDKFGVSWQVVPTILPEMLQDADESRSQRVMQAMLQMKKLDIDDLKAAYEGGRETA